MARIIIADHAGACYGVERALKMVTDAAAEGGPLSTLGPLIHNPSVVRELEARGVTVAKTPEEAAGRTLVLRTHGVTPDEEARARNACSQVLDATCPFVLRCHKAAERLVREGYQVIIVGEAGHPEVEGTRGHAPDALVVGSAADLDGVKLERKVGLVVQTTMTASLLQDIVAALLGRVEELRVFDTICEATSERQQAARELAAQADVMVVIGGHNSANTRHLADICSEICPATHHVEDAAELDPAWFANAGTIGITAGASTPTAQIEAAVAAIKKMDEEGA